MTGGVDQVQNIHLTVLRLVFNAHGIGLDRDAPLPLDIHRVEHLLFHFARRNGVRRLDQTVGQGRFPVVDMGNDGEVADMVKLGHGWQISEVQGTWKMA